MEIQPPTKKDIFDYYTSDFITKQLIKNSKNREVAAAFPNGAYDKRPNILQFPSDIMQLANKGITSFHLSVERWSNAMGLGPENYDNLRIGWDFVIDIDSKLGLDEAKIAAILITDLLHHYRIKNYNVKFSGRRGFHIIVPWEMFPLEVDYKSLALRYPEIPRILARFIRQKIANSLLKELLSLPETKQFTGVMNEEEEMNPFYLVEVEKDWGNRHMFRAPFSLNEKTWLVSIPVKDLRNFKKEHATMDNTLAAKEVEFLRGEENEAVDLLTDALDWYATIKKEEPEKKRKWEKWENKIEENKFPPCIKFILEGLEDGKKRSIFTLINFLRMMNWNPEEIENKILEWNKNNKPPLPQSTVLAQLRYHERRESIPPANCDADGYYRDIGVCRPDETCKNNGQIITIKNPVNYPFRKLKLNKKPNKGYSCSICKQRFKSMNSLNIHIGRYHKSDA